MKKVLICGVLAAAFGMAHAATNLDGYIQVKATLAPTCTASNPAAAPAVIDFGQYTAFVGPATAAPTANVVFVCSRGLNPTGGTLSGGTGFVAGVAYSLSVGTRTSSGGAAATGTTSATAVTYTYPITGSIAAGEAGDTGASLTDTQTLTISF